MARRFTVAWQLREEREMTTFRHAWERMTVDEILAEPRVVRLDKWWCGADKPEHVRVAPVYNSTEVPEDACCADCGIPIRELQEMMGARG